jgi:hypothetical protein
VRGSQVCLVALTIAACVCSAAQDQPCAAFLGKDDSPSRRFLEEQGNTRGSRCIVPVIKHLGQARDVKAVGVLISYLDYVDPATAPRPSGGADIRPHYPAITALFLIGTPATLPLLTTIEDSHDSKIRHNATLAYSSIYRDDLASGIRRAREQESHSNSVSGREHLRNLVDVLLQQCNGRLAKEAEECKNAVEK